VGFISGLGVLIIVKTNCPRFSASKAGKANVWERLYDFVIHLPENTSPHIGRSLVCLALLILLERYFSSDSCALVALIVELLYLS